MIVDPFSEPGRLLRGAIEDKIAALRHVIGHDPAHRTELTAYLELLAQLRPLDAAPRPSTKAPLPEWVTRGKTIHQLIAELRSFEDQNLQVRLSIDGGATHACISILTRRDGYCMLENHEND